VKNRLPLIAVLALPLAAPVLHAQDVTACNQYGRELALRASEEGVLTLDGAQRAALAQLAETVCLEFRADAPAPAATSAPAGPDQVPAAAESGEKNGLFDFEIIDPQDRVRRPGLKRL